jgi:hypothetical protein
MNSLVQSVKIQDKLYKCRDNARFLFGENYEKQLQPYKDIIQIVMDKHQKKELEAILIISQTEMYKEDGRTQFMFMAAACEMIEPSTVTA